MYSAQLKQFFNDVSHVGELHGAAVSVVQAGEYGRSDMILWYIEVSAQRVQQVRFKAVGSPAIIACGAYLAQLVEAMTRDEVLQLQFAQVAEALQLSATQSSAAQLALATLQQGLGGQ